MAIPLAWIIGLGAVGVAAAALAAAGEKRPTAGEKLRMPEEPLPRGGDGPTPGYDDRYAQLPDWSWSQTAEHKRGAGTIPTHQVTENIGGGAGYAYTWVVVDGLTGDRVEGWAWDPMQALKDSRAAYLRYTQDRPPRFRYTTVSSQGEPSYPPGPWDFPAYWGPG